MARLAISWGADPNNGISLSKLEGRVPSVSRPKRNEPGGFGPTLARPAMDRRIECASTWHGGRRLGVSELSRR